MAQMMAEVVKSPEPPGLCTMDVARRPARSSKDDPWL